MTFNFVVMLIVLVLLITDYVFSQRSVDGSGIFLIGNINSYDTGIRFGLLLYIIYVFGRNRKAHNDALALERSACDSLVQVPSNSRLGSPMSVLGTTTIGKCTSRSPLQ